MMYSDHTVPRRAKHTHEELREIILKAATELIEEKGLEGLSAREVARRINYSPGTLYNVFKDRDEILLTIESRLLDSLETYLSHLPPSDAARGQVIALANAYLQFTHANPNLWNLLFEHQLGRGRAAPAWYTEKIQALMQKIEAAIAPLMQGRSQGDIERAGRVLWASLHGITSLSTANRLSNVTGDSAQVLIENLVATYLDGLEAKPSEANRRA